MALSDLSGATIQTLTFEVSEFLVIMPTHALTDVFFPFINKTDHENTKRHSSLL